MLRSRRQFFAGAAAAVTLPAVTGCANAAPDDYIRVAAELRAPIQTSATLTDLVRYATLAANGHNTQPWRFVARASGLSVLPDFSRRTPVVDPDDHHLWISLGCAAENLLIAAAARGQAGAIAMRADATGIDIDLVAAIHPLGLRSKSGFGRHARRTRSRRERWTRGRAAVDVFGGSQPRARLRRTGQQHADG
jgi:hypothetical protein